MERELYQWQEKCLERWQAAGGRGIVQAVTGSGKTFLALTAMSRLDREQNGRLLVRIVVPTGALMLQWSRALREYLSASCGGGAAHGGGAADRDGGNTADGDGTACGGGAAHGQQEGIGLRGGGFRSDPECKYLIYVINSARYELARQILGELRRGEAVLLIADECHRYESGQNRLIFEFLPHMGEHGGRFFSLGLSATLPSGQGRRYLESVLGRSIYSYGMAEAQAMRTVCRYDVYHIGLSFEDGERMEYDELSESMNLLFGKLLQVCPALKEMDLKERYEQLGRLAGDRDRKIAQMASKYVGLSYKRKKLVCLASARISCVRELVERLRSDERILVFGERIGQMEELYGILRERYPGRVGRCHSGLSRQASRNALERFRTGETRILLTCRAMDEGIDLPDASVGIILSGTGTRRQRIQRLGRIVRKREGKREAALYYLHVEESVEDVCFLPEGGENRIYELEYDSGSGCFLSPAYDSAADAVLERMQRDGADERMRKEVLRCLELGSVRSDWLLDREEIDRQIKAAGKVNERNYWVCMKRMRAAAESAEDGRNGDGQNEDQKE